MLSKFTKREKVLLYILLVLCIVVAGVRFAAVPAWEKRAGLKEQVAEAEINYNMQKRQAEQALDLQAQIDALRDAEAAAGGGMPYMNEETLQRYLTEVSGRCGLSCFELTFSPYTRERLWTEAEKLLIAENPELEQTLGTQVLTVRVNARLSGDQADYVRFVDELCKKNNISVESLDIAVVEEDEKKKARIIFSDRVLSMDFIVMMTEESETQAE